MNVLSFIIDAKDQATATLGKVKNSFAELGADWKKAMAGMKEGSYSGLLSFGMKLAPVIAAAGAGLRAFGEVVRWVGEGIEENIKLEKMAVQMSRLTGSMRSARAEIESLTKGKFAVDDLFGEEDVIKASMALKRFSSGVVGSAGDIEILAAAAYATDQSVTDVAHSVGLLTGKIIAGEDSWGRYAEQLVKSGTVSRDVVAQMEEMKNSGKGAGEMIAFLMGHLNTKYSGTLDEARKSLDGIRRAADDAAGDASKAWGENYQSMVEYFHKIRTGWWNVVEFFASHPISIAGISKGLTEKLFGKKKDESKDDATSGEDMIAKGNSAAANATETDDARNARLEKEKKTANEEAKLHDDLLKRKAEAQKAYDDAQRDRNQKLEDRQRQALDAQMWANSMIPGSNARLENEAKVLELNKEILEIKKDISNEDERKSESLMKRDRNLREMSMTPDEKRAESKKRQTDLEGQLATENDPGKKLDIRSKIMDELEGQASLSKTGMRSLSVGDLYAKNDKNGGRRDPALQQVDLMKDIKETLARIEKKPGGMTK